MVADVPVTQTGPGPGLGVRDADGRPRRESRTSSRVVEPGLGLFRRRAAVAIASSVSLWPDPNRFHAWGQEQQAKRRVRVILLASKISYVRLSVCLSLDRFVLSNPVESFVRSFVHFELSTNESVLYPFNFSDSRPNESRDLQLEMQRFIRCPMSNYFRNYATSFIDSSSRKELFIGYSTDTRRDHDSKESGKQ